MKKLYQILSTVLALAMLMSFVGCSGGSDTPVQTPGSGGTKPVESSSTPIPSPEPVHVNIAALKGPTGMGMSYLMKSAENGETNNDYSVFLSGAPDEVSGKFINGELDIAAVPINLAAVLASKTDNVQILAVNTLGVLYVLENGDSVQSIYDLDGKKLFATGQASTPEYVLSYLLEQNDLTDAVEVEYLTEHSELATLMAAGECDLGMMPEPNVTVVTTKNTDVRVALDLTNEWYNVTGTQLVQGCIIARADFVQENPEAINIFLDEYAQSVDYVNNDHTGAAQLIAEYGIVASAEIAEKAIENCNIVCLTGDEMYQSADAMYSVLFEANPKSIGGAIPGPDIYYFY